MSDLLTPIEVSRQLLEQVYQEARRAFPHECCGWLAGPRAGKSVAEVRPCVNAQASGTHPTAADRTAETAYVLSAPDLLEFNRRLDSPNPPLIMYHSHPNGRAYFSPTDRQVARSPWGDGPAYPVQQLVVGIDARRVVEAALFTWSDAVGDFVEIARFPGASI
ncbi:MAG: hypothetical protein FJ316_08455 [SAR202 cluster bacterium]|nr:hypothetical protein [SAR202 cluster bacterium]